MTKTITRILSLLLLMAIGYQAQADQFILKPSRTADIPIDAKQGYGIHLNPKTLRLWHDAWMWNRVLLHFDLDMATYRQFDSIEAKLVFKVTNVKNPQKQPIVLGSPFVQWKSAKKLAYYGAPWPQRMKGHEYRCPEGVIEYAYDTFGNAQTVTQDGQVVMDVTDLMTKHIMCGRPWNGFILRCNPMSIGWNKSNAPENSYRIPSDSVQLVITATGKAPKQVKALRYFPSAHLPPVKSPYIFLFYNWNVENKILWDKYLKIVNTDGIFNDTDLLQKGILGLKGLTGPQDQWLTTPEACYNYYRPHLPGVALDEWQRADNSKGLRDPYTDPKDKKGKNILAAIEGLKRLKKEAPDRFLAVYWRGEKSMQPLAKYGLPDLVIAEAYTRMPQFPQWEIGEAKDIFHPRHAKEDGYYDRLILMHGIICPMDHYPKYKRHFTPEIIDAEVRECRERWPEIAGSGIFCEDLGTHGKFVFEKSLKVMLPIIQAYEKALQKYFLDPAPKVTVTAPAFEAILRHPKVLIQAQATAKDGRTIREYRWFVDNRLMATTTEPAWMWDLRPEKEGPHLITVHAVDSKYNRAATQLPVTIQR